MVSLPNLFNKFLEDPNFFLAQAAQTGFSFIASPNGLFFALVKILFIILGIAIASAVIYFLITTNYLRYRVLQDFVEFFTYKPYGAKKAVKAWTKILNRLELPDEAEYKLSIIEADDLVDITLKRMGYVGENLAERLSHLTAVSLPNIADLTQAHNTRNNIVHDPDYRLTLDQARKTLEIYEQALRHLQVLE